MEWFEQWAEYHCRINLKTTWPQKKTEEFKDFFGNWKARFRERSITEEEARAASKHLATQGAILHDDHLHKILEHILIGRRKVMQEAEQEKRLRARALNDRIHARRLKLEWSWVNLDAAQRERIEAACRAEHPHLAHVPRWLKQFALERMVAEGLCADPDPELAAPPSPE